MDGWRSLVLFCFFTGVPPVLMSISWSSWLVNLSLILGPSPGLYTQ